MMGELYKIGEGGLSQDYQQAALTLWASKPMATM